MHDSMVSFHSNIVITSSFQAILYPVVSCKLTVSLLYCVIIDSPGTYRAQGVGSCPLPP